MHTHAALETLVEPDRLAIRVAELAHEIQRDTPTNVHLVAVLKGAFVFLADLIRHFETPVTLDFLAVSSYGQDRTSSGEVRLLKDLDLAIDGRDVVIVDDIVDTGRTLAYLQDILRRRHPRTLRSACLLDKPTRREVPVVIDYIGFTIEDRFVVGYGLDDSERFRHLPYIAALPRSRSGG